jgi:flagellar basal body-associated protein FliL
MTTATLPAAPASVRRFPKVTSLLLMAAVGVGQVGVAVLFLRNAPENASPPETPAAPVAEVPNPKHEPAPAPPVAHEEPAKETPAPAHDSEHGAETELEVDLGAFSLTVPQVAGRSTLLVSFHLYGTVAEQHQAEFHERFEAYKHRIRHDVLILVRGADLGVLSDPELVKLKRLILDRINRSLGKAALSDIVFSDFAILAP